MSGNQTLTLSPLFQLAKLLTGEFSDTITQYTILDCRYPYEYDGGHIQGAVNIWEKEALLERFFKDPQRPAVESRAVIIFHCEFSSKRGPDMYVLRTGLQP